MDLVLVAVAFIPMVKQPTTVLAIMEALRLSTAEMAVLLDLLVDLTEEMVVLAVVVLVGTIHSVARAAVVATQAVKAELGVVKKVVGAAVLMPMVPILIRQQGLTLDTDLLVSRNYKTL